MTDTDMAAKLLDNARAARVVRVTVAQLNATVGDVTGNTARIVEVLGQARELGSDIVAFPELAVCGYPPEDLLLRPSFLAANAEAIARITPHTVGLTAIVGFAHRDLDVYNSAAVLHDGVVADVYHKVLLPNYSVFDEQRYFREGELAPVYVRDAVRVGVSVCEDMWHPSGPPQAQALAGADILVNISASPFFAGKARERERMLATRAADSVAFVVLCNLVGGQDGLVFDGNSLVINPMGDLVRRGASMAEDVFTVDVDSEIVFHARLLDPRHRSVDTPQAVASTTTISLPGLPPQVGESPPLPEREDPEPLDGMAEVYAALVLGVRDYVHKNGFEDVVIGLSGGIDSALTAAIAVDALGPEHVLGVTMPSRYSSASSVTDAEDLAANLGVELITVPVDDVFQAYLDLLVPYFGDLAPDVTEENIQPRIRGNVLMALSNKLGHLVLTTGNKSEVSVGYFTIYGDSAGGFAPLQDVPKTLVYDLARWRNEQVDGPHIPDHSISRPPSAELRPDQLDEDSLPPYDVLDAILEAYIEDERGLDEIAELGFEPAVAERVAQLVDRAEYKRRQSPPGVKISERAFGRDRRMPITKRDRTRWLADD
ncbi:MAG: NAD+ synthase [Anaerolineae bacterium]